MQANHQTVYHTQKVSPLINFFGGWIINPTKTIEHQQKLGGLSTKLYLWKGWSQFQSEMLAFSGVAYGVCKTWSDPPSEHESHLLNHSSTSHHTPLVSIHTTLQNATVCGPLTHTHVTWFMRQHHIAATPHSCHMIHAATPHDSCGNTTWSMQQHHVIHAAKPHDSCSNTTWFMQQYHMIHAATPYDSCSNTTWFMQQHHMIHAATPHDSCGNTTWFMQQHHMIHAATPHDACSNTTWCMQQHHMIHAATPHKSCSNTTWCMQQHHMIHAATPHDSCGNTTWFMQQHHIIHAATPHHNSEGFLGVGN